MVSEYKGLKDLDKHQEKQRKKTREKDKRGRQEEKNTNGNHLTHNDG